MCLGQCEYVWQDKQHPPPPTPRPVPQLISWFEKHDYIQNCIFYCQHHNPPAPTATTTSESKIKLRMQSRYA